ncbi:MAG: 5-formyltetrahydrofolate cyclo-ligase [Candidatus Omnitrophota bacterium]|jgi:5-formyltetrahydrofolate cyclo-ligase
MSKTLTKRQLRNILLTRLRRNTRQQRERKSRLIERKLLKQEEFVKAERIMFYLAFDGEVNTESMINKARELGKQIYVPLCDTKKKTLRPCVLMKDSAFTKGPYQTWEPQTKIDLPLDKLDMVIVPALAFDKNGNRLGRGKGYYDRFLKKISHYTYSIGLAFDFQILPSLPVGQDDMPVDKILSA